MMDIVIQCAATKVANAGQFRSKDGRPVHFVARPEFCSQREGRIYARPDDPSDVEGVSWRSRLEEYVRDSGAENPLGLQQAYQLYAHKAYAALAQRFGVEHLFILSAGWGLIRADYLTPSYDVTFNRRAKDKNPPAFCPSIEGYRFFRQLHEGGGPIVFLGGRDYLLLFNKLTAELSRERIVFVRSGEHGETQTGKSKHAYETRPFPVSARTNWHYQCAHALTRGEVAI